MRFINMKFSDDCSEGVFKLAETLEDVSNLRDYHYTFYVFVKCATRRINHNYEVEIQFMTKDNNIIDIVLSKTCAISLMNKMYTNETYLLPVFFSNINSKLNFNDRYNIFCVNGRYYFTQNK